MAAYQRIAITPGEPAGIGIDLVIETAKQDFPAELIVIADKDLIKERAKLLKKTVELLPYDSSHPIQHNKQGTLKVLHIPAINIRCCGQPDIANASYVIKCLQIAVEKCLSGEFAALVTGPVNKAVINKSGIAFQGHTELLAKLTQTQHFVMMLQAGDLRVALVTTHIPLAQVSSAITKERLRNTLQVLDHDLRKRFNIAKPRIFISGLNPHAGEQGHMGHEEIEIIEPVIQELIAQGMDLYGPLPADTLFTPKYLQDADAFLVMYHDQGLPVLKFKGFGAAVNISLGLPIIRTSVDHGTAFDLAGTGKADPHSLFNAIETAITLASKRNTS